MTLEDLAFDLGDLRELTRTRGIKRQKHLYPLMQISGDFELPETRRWEHAKLIAVAVGLTCMLALVVAMLIDRSGGEATKFGKICLRAGYFAFLIAAAVVVFAAAMQRRARVKALTALSETRMRAHRNWMKRNSTRFAGAKSMFPNPFSKKKSLRICAVAAFAAQKCFRQTANAALNAETRG